MDNNTISILIVEDEQIWIQYLQLMFEDCGYSISGIVSTADEALKAFGSVDFDVALIDINLNGRTSGIELGKIVHKVYNKPFIWLTSFAGNRLDDASSAKPAAYLTKPVNATSLFIAIQNAIANVYNHDDPDNKQEASFFVKIGNRYKKVFWKDVAYLSAGKNYVSVYNTVDDSVYFIRSSLQRTLKEIIPQNLKKDFIQINRADVLQVSFINEVEQDEIKTMYKSFLVSDAFRRDLREKLNIIS